MPEQLPRWETQSLYPSLDDPAFAADLAAAFEAIGQLEQRFDALGIAKRPAPGGAPGDAAAFDEVIGALGALSERLTTLRAFIYCFVSTDSRDPAAQMRLSELQQRYVALSQLDARLTAWVGSGDAEALLEHAAEGERHSHMLRRTLVEATHQMSPAEEELAAELGPSGGDAWSRLYSDISSQITTQVTIDGAPQELPISMVRNLAYEPSRQRRAAAYAAELAAWKRYEVPLAAAMNAIKGEVGTLARRRRWGDSLDQALFENAIDRATLDAMLGAARESFPDFRRYMRAKARMLGVERLAWYDLFAPVGGEEGGGWSYAHAQQFIVEQFGTFSPQLAGLAQRAFAEGWVDAEPRAGKVGGAFCMRVRGGESRILMNFTSSVNSMLTLAHELGHAYHNLCLAGEAPLNRTTPMTLAETASIFCETVVRKAALAACAPAERLGLIEATLQSATQVVVDISSRFTLEQAVFSGRQARALSPDELSALMRDAQLATYGDGLDPDALHAHMWAAKPHYYNSGRSFYNFPYMFGMLFGLGLYAIYRREPEGFVERYNALLAATGRADAAELAARVGIDIRSVDFWRASLDTVREEIDEFERLAGA